MAPEDGEDSCYRGASVPLKTPHSLLKRNLKKDCFQAHRGWALVGDTGVIHHIWEKRDLAAPRCKNVLEGHVTHTMITPGPNRLPNTSQQRSHLCSVQDTPPQESTRLEGIQKRVSQCVATVRDQGSRKEPRGFSQTPPQKGRGVSRNTTHLRSLSHSSVKCVMNSYQF